MRATLEAILMHPAGVDADTLAEIRRYTKLFWINSGPHNNVTARKFVLKCPPAALRDAAEIAEREGATFPKRPGESVAAMLDRLRGPLFDPAVDPLVTNKTPGPGADILQASANNLYDGVTMADLAGFEERYGLNSRLVKQEGRLFEEVCRTGGRYGAQIAAIVRHLQAALPFAPPPTRRALEALIRFYETGEDADRVSYDVAWVEDRGSAVDASTGSSRTTSMRVA
jgi:dipeptidyl-peptidase-3